VILCEASWSWHIGRIEQIAGIVWEGWIALDGKGEARHAESLVMICRRNSLNVAQSNTTALVVAQPK
jgi:hypothetical protein